jgi:PIN domain nuclease of toxin-antitoxin system
MPAFLLDTHTLLWFVAGSDQLSKTARTAIESAANERYVSIVSIWEIAIKSSTGKLKLALSIEDFVSQHVLGNGFLVLDIMIDHAVVVAALPWHHRDPFDRMLIAQASVENMPLLSADQPSTLIHRYNVFGSALQKKCNIENLENSTENRNRVQRETYRIRRIR